MKKRGFTVIEFLVALAIIGFIVALLVGVFASPIKQARLDTDLATVKDGFRQTVEAQGVAILQNKCTSG